MNPAGVTKEEKGITAEYAESPLFINYSGNNEKMSGTALLPYFRQFFHISVAKSVPTF